MGETHETGHYDGTAAVITDDTMLHTMTAGHSARATESESCPDPDPSSSSPGEKRKQRRNGLWNIFEGVDSAVLEKLGLSEDLVHQLVTEADDTVSEHLSRTAGRSLTPDPADPHACRCRRARILRSFSATVGEDVRAALQNRRRRNAVGNLFEILTSSQKILLVEHLQEQLERLHCLCEGDRRRLDTAGTGSVGRAIRAGGGESSSEVILNLADFTAPTSSVSPSSGSGVEPSVSQSSPPQSAQGQVLCH